LKALLPGHGKYDIIALENKGKEVSQWTAIPEAGQTGFHPGCKHIPGWVGRLSGLLPLAY